MTHADGGSLLTETVTMTVLRDGYWDGGYAHEGDVIAVPTALVDILQLNGFAMRREPVEQTVETRRSTKGPKHGR